MHKTELTN